MGPDLLRRIRWGNVGRLAGALAVVAAVAAWPRLAPPQPALPGEGARPLDGLPTATPPAELLTPRPPRAIRRPGGRALRPRAGSRGESGEARPRDRRTRESERRSRPGRERGDGREAAERLGGERPDGEDANRGAERHGEVGRDVGDERGGNDAGGESDESGGRNDAGGESDESGGGTRRGSDPAQTEFGFERG